LPKLRARLQQSLGEKYRIIRELTGGGMSRVFLAEEAALEREVAIKVLSPELVDEKLLARFRQEMLHTARLQHPTIVPILEAGTLADVDGRSLPYYVMSYVRGESLRSRLQHEGQLSCALSVKIVKNVLEALVHAHANGVVHRDIKPENIFISGTSTVLADFGIAKAVTMDTPSGPNEQSGGAKDPLISALTRPGTTVGTPAYMAPEQIAGDSMMDHRADLYAVGVVAYEMLAGRLPWDGRTSADVIASKARNRIVPLRSLRPDVPVTLESVIVACLSWDVEERPQSAMEVLRVVEAVALTPVTPSSLVTGSSRPVRRRPSNGWLLAGAAGVALAGLAAAATINGMGENDAVAPSPSSIRFAVLYPEFRSANNDASTLRELLYHLFTSSLHSAGVRLLQEVSISQMAERGLTQSDVSDTLRIAGVDSVLVMEATPAAGGSYLLSVHLRRLTLESSQVIAGPISVNSLATLAPDSVLQLVKVISGQVAAHFGLQSTVASNVPQTAIREAFDAYTRGKDAYAKRTPSAIREAIANFEQAIALDSNFAQAHADLSSAIALSLFYHYRQPQPPYELAKRALALANRAIALQPTFADAYVARGYLGGVTGAPASYLKENYGTAQRYTAANPFSQLWYINIIFAEGRYAEALSRIQEEVRRDPKSPAHWVSLALYALPAKQYDTAAVAASRARAMQPGIPFLADLELWARRLLGGRALDECGQVEPGPYLGAWALCLEALEHGPEARTALDSLRRMAASSDQSTFDRSLYAGELAGYYASRGDVANARQWLIRAFDESPAGIDYRLMRAGIFNNALVSLADTLRARSWARVSEVTGDSAKGATR
jgi:serine/threonine protein kinase